MQPMRRNQRPYWYANLISVEPQEGEYGPTGQINTQYGAPVRGKGNIAPATGEKLTQQFGEVLDYDTVLLPRAGDMISETTVLWVDCVEKPIPNEDGSFTPPWTHEVKRVAGSLNNTLVALKQVTVR